ncbi:MAG: CoA ester lyase [Burkholderiales bacterium]|nr:CoA ester lyase [Burkholderiales bacterium]
MRDPDLRRTWLFGAGAERATHAAMAASGADVLIQDLEDFTPPARRAEARALAAPLYASWRAAGRIACVRINRLRDGGADDLDAVLAARPDIVAYPKAAGAADMRELDAELARRERALGLPVGTTELLPVAETALGVVTVREMAAASPRVRCALLGAEDLAADLCAERGRDAVELDHARRRFLLECRAAGIEPVDAPYTFADADGAAAEAAYARRLGYRCKSLVRPEHAARLNAVLTPSADECDRARRLIAAFAAGRARGEDRVLVDGLWVEVPMVMTAERLLARAARLAGAER